jgi:hypothetical protein
MSGGGPVLAWTVLAGALTLAASQARADVDLVSPETVSALVDLRVAVADGERSWVDGGFGKTRFGGDGGLEAHAAVAVAAVLWAPRFSWDLTGLFDIEAQSGQDRGVDVVEAYLRYRPVPTSAWRASGRFGLFYPPISLEHDDKGWQVSRTITPSAINSWVSEEVKVIGAEATLSHVSDAGGEAGLTGAIFSYNDTAGTLLTYRGWALDDVRTGAFSAFPLPALSAFSQHIQPPETYPTREIDNRAGWYLRADWRAGAPIALNAFYYDNRGNKTGVTPSGQWAWATRFLNLGLSIDLDQETQVLAQGMSGRTLMGFETPRGIWYDVDFDAAYFLLSHSFGASALTGRVDWFRTRDRTLQAIDNNDEQGWAATLAWRRRLTTHAKLFVEALHTTSNRPSRLYDAIEARQGQTLVQSALRLSF